MCGSKSGRQKDLCFKKIRIHAQPLLLILDSIVNTKLMGGLASCYMALALLTLRIHNNMGDQIHIWLQKISCHICKVKQNPNFELQVENHGKKTKLNQ